MLPIAMLSVKYKSPIERSGEENNPMKIRNSVLEQRKQSFRSGELWQFGGLRINSNQKVEENEELDWPYVENTEIITEEKNKWRRLIIEGMEIKKLDENRANGQVGYEIDELWNPHNREAKVVNTIVLRVFRKNCFKVWSMKIQNENALQRNWYSLECFLNLICISVENRWRRLPIGSQPYSPNLRRVPCLFIKHLHC